MGTTAVVLADIGELARRGQGAALPTVACALRITLLLVVEQGLPANFAWTPLRQSCNATCKLEDER